MGGASFLIGVGFLFQALADLFIARHLTAAQYGGFTLIFRDVANILVVLTLLGIDSSLIRRIATSPLSSFAWRNLSRKILLLFILIAVALAIGIKVIYGIDLASLIALAFLVILLAFVNLRATVLRINGTIFSAQLSIQLWRIIFPFVAVGLFFINFFTPISLAIGLIAATLGSLLFANSQSKNLQEGTAVVNLRPLLREGILFFGLSASSLMMIKVERLFLGGMRPLADVGAYYAVSLAVVTAYSVAASGSSYVLLPHFAQGGTIKIKRNLFILFLVGLFIAAFYVIFGPQLIHWLFKGKYDNFIFLIPYFIIIGILQLLYLLPSTFVGGRATAQMLQEFLYFGIISLAINVTLCIILIPQFGLQGAALSTLAAWIFRLGSAFFFTRKILRTNKTRLFETMTFNG